MRPFLILLSVLFFSLNLFAQPVTRYALLVGIGQYPKESNWPLLHADEDANRLKSELLQQGYLEANIKTLINEEASYDNIRLAFKEISTHAEPEDQITVYMGGHSQRITDVSGDEVDGLDEAFVSYDAFSRYKATYYEGNAHFLDDEISKWISILSNKVTRNGNLFFIYDGGISPEKSLLQTCKGIHPPFKFPAYFKNNSATFEVKDNSWLDFSYTAAFPQVISLDPGANAKVVSEVPIGAKKRGSPLVQAYLKTITNQTGAKRYRDMEPVLTAIFTRHKMNPAFHLDGNTNLDLKKPTTKATTETLSETQEGDYKVFSVVIGVSNYLQISKLKYGHLDAKLFSDMLVSVYKDRLKKENQYIFLDSNATVKPIMDAFQAIEENSREGDKIYFYFAGHGDVENLITKKAHLLLFDSPTAVYKSGGTLRVEDIKDYFTQWMYKKAKVFLVVDACRSGKLAGGEEGQAMAANNINELQAHSARILSCHPNESSQESERFGGGHGAFTHFLVRGITGAANADHDKNISLGEIRKFVVDSVSSITANAQNPMVEGNSKTTFLPALENYEISSDVSSKENIVVNSDSRNTAIEDSLKVRWSKELRKEIVAGRLVSPVEKSAKQVMERMSNTWPFDRKLLASLKTEIANAIVLKSQRIVNQYIEGNETITKESVFKESAKEMEYLLELIELDNPLYFTYLARKYFFDGRSILPSMVDNDKKRYQLEIAIKNLQTSLKYEPEGAHNLNAIARLQQANRQFDEAIASYKKAVYLAPRWKFPYNNLGAAWEEYANYNNKKNYNDSAIYYYQQAMKVDPEYAVAFINLGKTYANLGKGGLAKSSYLKSIFLNPERIEAYQNMGDIYRKEQKWDSASYYLRQGIALQKENVNLITNLGNVFFDQSNYDKERKTSLLEKARNQFLTALNIDSLCLEANFGMGNYFWETSVYDSAAYFYKICLMMDSNDVINSNYYIEALTRSGKEKIAENLAIKLSKKHPENATNWFDLTVLAAIRKDFKQAELYMNKSVKAGNTDKTLYEDDPFLNEFRKQNGYKKLLNNLK